MLLRRGSRPSALQLFDICRHVLGLDAPESANLLPFAPAQEISGGPRARRARALVADIDCEEFKEAKRGSLPRR